MSGKVNKQGLSRDIPNEVKLQVRQECGFGCVCCGLAIAMYEHIRPEFHEAESHDPNHIALLCGSCHDRVTRGVWSKEKIVKARENPYCIKTGHCHDSFDIGQNSDIIIRVGSNEIVGFERIFFVDDFRLLAIEAPESAGAPYRLSGLFFDGDENLLFEIDQNEWLGESNQWDIQCKGPMITIRTAPGKIALQLTCFPNRGIFINKMNMSFHDAKIFADEYELRFKGRTGGTVKVGGRLIQSNNRGKILLHSVDGTTHLGGGVHEGSFSIGELTKYTFGGQLGFKKPKKRSAKKRKT